MGSRKTVPPLGVVSRCRSATAQGEGHSQDIPDSSVRRQPHLLQLEFLDAALIRGDGGALDAHAIFLDGLGRVDGNLVIGLVAVLEALRGVSGIANALAAHIPSRSISDRYRGTGGSAGTSLLAPVNNQTKSNKTKLGLTFSLISFQIMRVI